MNADALPVDQLFLFCYEELRRLARGQLARERGAHTLDPTALVHEVYMKWVDGGRATCGDGGLQRIAARLMRQVLVNHAKARQTLKRGASLTRRPLEDLLPLYERRGVDLADVDEALDRLRLIDERQHDIVELRYFCGLTTAEVAAILKVSTRTVRRDWDIAQAWLRVQLEDGPADRR